MAEYRLYNKTSKQFYKSLGPTYKVEGENYHKSKITYAARGTGKKFSDMGKLKIHLLTMASYFEVYNIKAERKKGVERNSAEDKYIDMLFSGFTSLPDWMRNYYAADIPEDLIAVQYDPTTKAITPVDFDCKAYVDRMLRLRELIFDYGSAVKDVYSKIESKGKLDEYQRILVFNPKDIDVYLDKMYDYESIPAEPALTEAIERCAFKRGDYIKSEKNGLAAIALKDARRAVQLRLAYSGSRKVTFIDVKQLKTIVEDTAEDTPNA